MAAELFGECRLSCTERTSRGSCGKEGRARGTDQAPFELAGAWHQSRRSLRYVTLLVAIAGQQEEGFWQQRAYTYCFLWERGTDDDTDRRPAGIAAAKLFRQRPQSISDDPVERRAVDFEILVAQVVHSAGYNLLSFTRAFAVVKCQSALAYLPLRTASHAWTSSFNTC